MQSDARRTDCSFLFNQPHTKGQNMTDRGLYTDAFSGTDKTLSEAIRYMRNRTKSPVAQNCLRKLENVAAQRNAFDCNVKLLQVLESVSQAKEHGAPECIILGLSNWPTLRITLSLDYNIYIMDNNAAGDCRIKWDDENISG